MYLGVLFFQNNFVVAVYVTFIVILQFSVKNRYNPLFYILTKQMCSKQFRALIERLLNYDRGY